MYQVIGSRVEWNPCPARLRELTGQMPNASVTEFGNVNVRARVDSRSTRSTYLVDDSTNSRGQTITRAEYDRVVARLDQAQVAAYFMLGETTGTSAGARTRRASSCASRGRTRSSRATWLTWATGCSSPGLDESLVKSLG